MRISDWSSDVCSSDLQELQDRFEGGFDPARSVSAEPGELVPPAGLFVLARLEDRAVGCGGLKVTGPGEGEIKRMWVAPAARRSEESRVGRGCDSPCRSRWWPVP